MARKRDVTPMETQPIRSQIEAATPMAPAPPKPSKASRRSTPPITQSQADTARRAITQEAALHAERLTAESATVGSCQSLPLTPLP
jgi:hypothetical protein